VNLEVCFCQAAVSVLKKRLKASPSPFNGATRTAMSKRFGFRHIPQTAVSTNLAGPPAECNSAPIGFPGEVTTYAPAEVWPPSGAEHRRGPTSRPPAVSKLVHSRDVSEYV